MKKYYLFSDTAHRLLNHLQLTPATHPGRWLTVCLLLSLLPTSFSQNAQAQAPDLLLKGTSFNTGEACKYDV